jgi:flagellin-like protein
MKTGKRSQRGWRKSGKRGVSPIIATILLVAITVVLAAVLYVLISGLTHGPGNTPIGSAMAVSSSTASGSGTWNNNTISIQTASSGVTANSLKFQLVNSGGTIQSFTAVTLIDVSGCVVDYYSGTTNAWATTLAVLPGAHTPPSLCANGLTLSSQISAGDQLIVTTATSISSMGDSLNIVGTGSYSGSIAAAIA